MNWCDEVMNVYLPPNSQTTQLEAVYPCGIRLDRMLKYAVYEMLALNQVYEQAAELDKYKSAAFPEWAHSCNWCF